MFSPFSLLFPLLPVSSSLTFPSLHPFAPRFPVDELMNLTNFLLSFLHISITVSTCLLGLRPLFDFLYLIYWARVVLRTENKIDRSFDRLCGIRRNFVFN